MAAEAEVGVLSVRAELVGAEVPVWRELLIAGSVTLYELHVALQICFGWDRAHLFQFEVGKRRLGVDDDVEDCRDVQVGEVVGPRSGRITYRYDFGDDWEVLLKVRREKSPIEGVLCLVGGEGAGPLEDCGGVFAHNEIVEHLTKGKAMDPDREEWIPEGYDPLQFDVQRVGRALADFGKSVEEGEWAEFDEEMMGEGGAGDVDILGAFPMDEFGEPVLYDPNDRRGPDPERWGALDESERIQSVRAYHAGDPSLPGEDSFDVHCSLHAVVEAQVLLGEPKEVGQALDRLSAGGRGRRHDAVHAVMIGLMEMMMRIREGEDGAVEAYARWVRGLTPEMLDAWREGEDLPPLPAAAKGGANLRLVRGGRGQKKRKKGRKGK